MSLGKTHTCVFTDDLLTGFLRGRLSPIRINVTAKAKQLAACQGISKSVHVYCMENRSILARHTFASCHRYHRCTHTHQFHEVFGFANIVRNGQQFVVADQQDTERQIEQELGQHGQLIPTEKKTQLVTTINQ